MLFGNVAAIVCTGIAIAAVIWSYKIEHHGGHHEEDDRQSANAEEKEEE